MSGRQAADAAGLCWLARQRGLPRIDGLRRAVVAHHPEPCRYCAVPGGDLLARIVVWLDANDPGYRPAGGAA